MTEIAKRVPDLAITESPLDEARLKELQAKYAIRLQIGDQTLRDRELKLKEGTSRFEKLTNPFTVALIAGAAGLIGTFFNGLWANLNEQTKLRNELIKEAIKPASAQERAKSLVFFATNRLIELEDDVVKSLIDIAGSNRPVPGSSGVAATPTSHRRVLTPDELNGFVIHVTRTRVEQREGLRRTVGQYRVTYQGQELAALKGFTVESRGPGNNSTPGSGQRLEAGGYPLQTWRGTNYVTTGYSVAKERTSLPRPAIGIGETGGRAGILIHPGSGFITAIGTINLSKPLDGPGADIEYGDSRQRVIDLIDAIKQRLGSQFPARDTASIPSAWVSITGEPGNEGDN